MDWLATPRALVDAYIEKLDQLRAEERLDEAAVVGIGGRLEHGSWMSSLMSAWRSTAGGLRRAAKATAMSLGTAGIKLKTVPRRKKAEAHG